MVAPVERSVEPTGKELEELHREASGHYLKGEFSKAIEIWRHLLDLQHDDERAREGIRLCEQLAGDGGTTTADEPLPALELDTGFFKQVQERMEPELTSRRLLVARMRRHPLVIVKRAAFAESGSTSPPRRGSTVPRDRLDPEGCSTTRPPVPIPHPRH